MSKASITYHIGDIHGRSDLATKLVRHLEADADRHGAQPLFSFLGDLVDRGHDSKGSVQCVIDTLAKWPGSILHLGNHDEWFLDALETDGKFMDAESWVINGGLATVTSYTEDFTMDSLRQIREGYPEHLDLLRKARLRSFSGPFIAVHAGINPALPLEGQGKRDFLWIRSMFLEYVDPDMRPVVHGHTIMGRLPVVTENRISIDTGAFHTDRLTCLAVDHDRQAIRFIQTLDDGTVAEIEPARADRGYGTLLDRLPALFEEYSLKEPTP